MPNASNSDVTIWQSFKAGDKTSFEKIYHSYFQNLYEYGVRLIEDRELVKDTIHDLFVKVWTNKSNLGEITNIKSYLLVSLRGALYNKVQKSNKVIIEDIDVFYSFRMDFSVETEFIDKECVDLQIKKLSEAMEHLSPRQKEVIYLKYLEELDYEEIAAIMNVSVKATYKLTARALDALKQILNISSTLLFILFAVIRTKLFS